MSIVKASRSARLAAGTAALLLALAVSPLARAEEGAAGAVREGMDSAADSTKRGLTRAGEAVGKALDTAISKTGEGVSHVIEKTGEGIQSAGRALSGDESKSEPEAEVERSHAPDEEIHEETLDE